MIQKLLVRLQNKKVLMSTVAGILLVLVNTGLIDVGMSHQVQIVFDTVMSILIGLGIVSDPESHVE